LNPSSAQAHHWFAIVLGAMNDRIEAISEAQTAAQLDPKVSSREGSRSDDLLLSTASLPEAIAECDAALQIDERFLPAIKVKRWTAVAMKDFPLAKATFQKELEVAGGSVDEPGWRLIELQVTGAGRRSRSEAEAARGSHQIRVDQEESESLRVRSGSRLQRSRRAGKGARLDR
jgi:hypothetical protein